MWLYIVTLAVDMLGNIIWICPLVHGIMLMFNLGRVWNFGTHGDFFDFDVGGHDSDHQYVRVLLHFTQFCIRRQVCHPPYGPWDHVPQDEGEVLCCQKCSTITVCGECKEIIVLNVLDPTLVGLML